MKPSTPLRAGRFPAIDGLRGVAILSITALHIWSVAGCPATIFAPLLAAGSFGPSIFFAISGFVLYLSYARDPNALRFYRRRAWRLIPAYYVAVLLWSVISPDHSLRQLWTHLTFTHGFWPDTLGGLTIPLWFIAPLVQFYLVFPFLADAMRRRPLLVALLAFGVSIAVQVPGGTLWQRSLLGHIAECVFGMYAAHLILAGHGARVPRWFSWATITAACCAPIALFNLHPVAYPPFWWWVSILCAPLWAALILVCTTSRVPFTKPLATVGRVSYSLYLYNLAGFALAPAFVWPLQLAITASVALAAYPLEQIGRYLEQVHRLIRRVVAVGTVANGSRNQPAPCYDQHQIPDSQN